MEDNFPIIWLGTVGVLALLFYGLTKFVAWADKMEKANAKEALEIERERIEIAAEKARLEKELGVDLGKPEPEIVYVEVEKPVYIEKDSGGMSEGSKTAIKAGVAGAAGYAIGRKWL